MANGRALVPLRLVSRVRLGLRKELRFVLTVHSTEATRSAGAEFGGQSSEVLGLEKEALEKAEELFAASQTVRAVEVGESRGV